MDDGIEFDIDPFGLHLRSMKVMYLYLLDVDVMSELWKAATLGPTLEPKPDLPLQ